MSSKHLIPSATLTNARGQTQKVPLSTLRRILEDRYSSTYSAALDNVPLKRRKRILKGILRNNKKLLLSEIETIGIKEIGGNWFTRDIEWTMKMPPEREVDIIDRPDFFYIAHRSCFTSPIMDTFISPLLIAFIVPAMGWTLWRIWNGNTGAGANLLIWSMNFFTIFKNR